MPATLTTETSPTESRNSSRTLEPASTAPHGAEPGYRFWRILLTLLALETGVFLLLVPWSSIWDGNFFLGQFSSLQPQLRSHYTRGAVSALGVVNIWVGLVEAWMLFRMRRSSRNR